MGLDSFWRLPKYPLNSDLNEKMFMELGNEKVEHPKFNPPLKLVGEITSGHGVESFRGKVYTDFIGDITEISLFQEEMSNEQVKKIADKLEATEYKKDWEEDYDLTKQNFNDLKRMFRAYADIGATLDGWW